MSTLKNKNCSRFFGILLALVFVLGLSSCSNQSSSGVSQAPQPTPTNTVRISPSELFTGELKRLEPHLGWHSGCVKLDYTGPKLPISLTVERWIGNETKSIDLIASSKFHDFDFSGTSEACISIQKVNDFQGKETHRLVTVLSKGRDTRVAADQMVDIPESSHFIKALGKEAKLANGQSIAVWALAPFKNNEEGFGAPSDKSVEAVVRQHSKWALVFKLALNEAN